MLATNDIYQIKEIESSVQIIKFSQKHQDKYKAQVQKKEEEEEEEESSSMSADLPPIPPIKQLHFAPLHRTVELENIHEQVTQNDLNKKEEKQVPTARKTLKKCMTVIGDGNDVDTNSMYTQ
ncbi:unnamed protein product [Rotaria socialis]|uniref:Uncharacterized protein n=3 Tax=Rotaria socialis TaxID=392032 RepID=A0A820FSE5_9BILA|nr:unnamed protein product [Rotaria socialis]CAF4268630.1 unnamed protein product [Rotaria socialis]